VFPTSRAIYDPSETGIEEERRLCYVAITRSKETLFITNAKSRRMYYETNYNKPSMFLKEIPKSLIQIVGMETTTETPKIVKQAFTMTAPKSGLPDYGAGDFIPAGADYEVTVEFDGVGKKKFMAHLSNLVKTD
jgi:DNA helicase-2/ATP-dependent DNA helicase PcrA